VSAIFRGRCAKSVCLLLLQPVPYGTEESPSRTSEGGETPLADYVTVAALVLPPPEPGGDDRAERLEKAEGLAAAIGAYAEVFVEDPGGDPEVVHRFARMLLALEEFELACLCQAQRIERQRHIERHRRFMAEEEYREAGRDELG
jgi:hypothetical protein